MLLTPRGGSFFDFAYGFLIVAAQTCVRFNGSHGSNALPSAGEKDDVASRLQILPDRRRLSAELGDADALCNNQEIPPAWLMCRIVQMFAALVRCHASHLISCASRANRPVHLSHSDTFVTVAAVPKAALHDHSCPGQKISKTKMQAPVPDTYIKPQPEAPINPHLEVKSKFYICALQHPKGGISASFVHIVHIYFRATRICTQQPQNAHGTGVLCTQNTCSVCVCIIGGR